MKKLMTRQFAKWAGKHKLSGKSLKAALKEVEDGFFDADLGGHVIKKRVRLAGKGKMRRRSDDHLLQKR